MTESPQKKKKTLIYKSIQETLYNSHNESYKVRESPKTKQNRTKN